MEVRRDARLIEVSGGQARAVGALHDSARIEAVDAAPVVCSEREGGRAPRRIGGAALGLPAAGGLNAVGDGVAELVEAESAPEQELAVIEANVLLNVAGLVSDVRVGARGHAGGDALLARVQADVDAVVVEVGAGDQDRGGPADPVWAGVLRVGAMLETRIVLLEGVAALGVVQEEGEIRVEI